MFNYGAGTGLKIQRGRVGNSSDHTSHILIKIDISSLSGLIDYSYQIESATLYLYKNSGVGVGTNPTLGRFLSNLDWIEGTKNGTQASIGEPCWDYRKYDNRGWNGISGSLTNERTINIGEQNGWKKYDVYDDVRKWFNGTNNNGWGIYDDTLGDEIYHSFISSEGTDSRRPYLEIVIRTGSSSSSSTSSSSSSTSSSSTSSSSLSSSSSISSSSFSISSTTWSEKRFITNDKSYRFESKKKAYKFSTKEHSNRFESINKIYRFSSKDKAYRFVTKTNQEK